MVRAREMKEEPLGKTKKFKKLIIKIGAMVK